jgi:zinc/manganese transport system substrate-binding protein
MSKSPLMLSLIALGLGMSSTAMAEEKVPVVASFSILGDLVSQVGGEHISVTTLVKANGDAHVYSPSPMDAKAVTHAKLLVVNGLGFEGWMPRLVESSNFTGEKVVASDGIDAMKGGCNHHDDDHQEHDSDHAEHVGHHDEDHTTHDHHHGEFDPHAWNSIANVKTYISNIEKGLSKVDPKHSSDYAANALHYTQKLDSLELQLHAEIDKIPASQRNVITPHDAFGYFSRDFDVTFIAPQGTSTESEASAADVAAIITQIREDNVTAVFMENIADNRMIEQISRETGAKIGGKLFSDALSSSAGPASTYIELMQYNVDTIVKALSH